MPEEEREVQARFGLGGGLPGKAGEFEILAMTAGEGNGWQFSDHVFPRFSAGGRA